MKKQKLVKERKPGSGKTLSTDTIDKCGFLLDTIKREIESVRYENQRLEDQPEDLIIKRQDLLDIADKYGVNDNHFSQLLKVLRGLGYIKIHGFSGTWTILQDIPNHMSFTDLLELFKKDSV